MRLALRRRTDSALPGVIGVARVDRRAEALLPRLRRGDIAVLDEVDLDRATADALVAAEVAGVVDASPCISGRYPTLIDPAHDFGKNTRHSLEITRRLGELVGTGWPVLVSLSRKDFVGETLDLPPDGRLEGTLATTAVSAWLGARVFRAHDVAATRRVLDMVASIRGTRPPAATRRGLA